MCRVASTLVRADWGGQSVVGSGQSVIGADQFVVRMDNGHLRLEWAIFI